MTECAGLIEVCLVLKAIQIEQRIMLSFQLHHPQWTCIFLMLKPMCGWAYFLPSGGCGFFMWTFFVVVRLWTCGCFLTFLLLVLTVWLQVLWCFSLQVSSQVLIVIAYIWQILQNNVFSFGSSVAWSNGVGFKLRMVVDILGGFVPLFFLLVSVLRIIVFSINMILLGMPRNVSECLGMYPKGWKIPNDHMSLLHVVQKLKLNAVHKWWTAVNWRDFARRGVSPFLNGNSWFVKRRLSPPCF